MPRRRGRCALADAEDDADGLMCVRPEQRHAANARERARMRVLARAFCRLKTTLPWVPADTKLSKLDTLRLAASYIAHLRAILTDEPAPAQAQHPLNLTWPFTFSQSGARSGGEWSGGSRGRAGDQLDHGGRPSSSASSSCGDAELEDDDYYAPHFSDSLLHLG